MIPPCPLHLHSGAGSRLVIDGVGSTDPLSNLIEIGMDPLQAGDPKDCAWTTLDCLTCGTNWETRYLPFTSSGARVARVMYPLFYTETSESWFERWYSALLCLCGPYVFFYTCGDLPVDLVVLMSSTLVVARMG